MSFRSVANGQGMATKKKEIGKIKGLTLLQPFWLYANKRVKAKTSKKRMTFNSRQSEFAPRISQTGTIDKSSGIPTKNHNFLETEALGPPFFSMELVGPAFKSKNTQRKGTKYP